MFGSLFELGRVLVAELRYFLHRIRRARGIKQFLGAFLEVLVSPYRKSHQPEMDDLATGTPLRLVADRHGYACN